MRNKEQIPDSMSPVFGTTRGDNPLAERREFPAYVFLKWVVYGRIAAEGTQGTDNAVAAAQRPKPHPDALHLAPAWVAQKAARLHARAGWAMPGTQGLETARAARHVLDRLDDGLTLRRAPNHPAEFPKFVWLEPLTQGTWASYRNLVGAADDRIDVAMAVHHVVERFGVGRIDLAALRGTYEQQTARRPSGMGRLLRRRRAAAPPGWPHQIVQSLRAAGALEDHATHGLVLTDQGLRMNHWYELFAYSVDYKPEAAEWADDAQ